MEQRFFKWNGWDQHDTMTFSFTNVELVAPMGDFPVGTKFDSAFVDYEKGIIEFFDYSDNVAASFDMIVTVAPRKVD